MKIFEAHPPPWTIEYNAASCGNGGAIHVILDAKGETVASSYWGFYGLWEFYKRFSLMNDKCSVCDTPATVKCVGYMPCSRDKHGNLRVHGTPEDPEVVAAGDYAVFRCPSCKTEWTGYTRGDVHITSWETVVVSLRRKSLLFNEELYPAQRLEALRDEVANLWSHFHPGKYCKVTYSPTSSSGWRKDGQYVRDLPEGVE